jgi:hypothetical protein
MTKYLLILIGLFFVWMTYGPFSFSRSYAQSSQQSCIFPGNILDLKNWKITLPVGSTNSAMEINNPELSRYQHEAYFRVNDECDGVRFRAPTSGVTTTGSDYPRSELREMTDSGSLKASWTTTSGSHSMFIDQAITAVPFIKRHVVAGQIHDQNDDVVTVRLEYPKLFIEINGADGPILDPNYMLGRRFTVQFIARDGRIEIYYNGGKQPALELKHAGAGNYFKAGAYTQSNCNTENFCGTDNYGEVMIYKLQVDHSSSQMTNLIKSNCSLYDSEVLSYNPYGLHWDWTTTQKDLLLKATCSSSSTTVDIGNGRETGSGSSMAGLTYVYHQGYYSTGSGWLPYALQCSGTDKTKIVGIWCKGSATASLPSNTKWFAGYTCIWTGSKWQCGCSDSTCATSYWQVQGIRR